MRPAVVGQCRHVIDCFAAEGWQQFMLVVLQRMSSSVIAGVVKLFIALLISALSPNLFKDNKWVELVKRSYKKE